MGCARSLGTTVLLAATLSAAPLAAATFTVGPGGTHATIQAAVDAAAAAGGDDEVRIAGGLTFTERVVVPEDALGGLRLSGGWNLAYSAILPGGRSRVDAAGSGRPFEIERCGTGLVEVSHLELTGGHITTEDSPVAAGGGLLVVAAGTCRVSLADLDIRGNAVEKSVPADDVFVSGGGLHAFVHESGHLAVRHSRIERNVVVNRADGVAKSGGADLTVRDGGSVSLSGVTIQENTVEAAGRQAAVAGLALAISEAADAEVIGSSIRGNRVVGGTERLFAGALVSSELCTSCSITLRRNRILDNSGATDLQLYLEIEGGVTAEVSDSIVAGGDAGGATFFVLEGSLVRVKNLTVADHVGQGLSFSTLSGGRTELENSIVFGNGTDSVSALGDGASVDPESNLIGVDPLFRDPALRDYRVRGTSPAIDAGDDTPPGGLGSTDVDGGPRVQGEHVDIGAHEWPAGGAPPGGTSAGRCRASEFPGVFNPIPADSPACRCVSDRVLRSLRCSFHLPDELFIVRIPLPAPFAPFEGDWTMLPWSGLEGPYRLAAQVLVEGEWHSLPLGKSGQLLVQGKLVDGKLEKGRFLGEAAAAPLELRLLLTDRPTQGKDRTWELEVALPLRDEEGAPQ